MTTAHARLIVAADTQGEVIASTEGLSFWGGVDPETGAVIDTHHPLHGASLAGKVVVIPTSRGSCSGSGVLLELALNGKAPGALVFREDEDILTLGALIAGMMFDLRVAVLRLPKDDHTRLGQQKTARLQGTELLAGDLHVELHPVGQSDLSLTAQDRAMLNAGGADTIAMQVIATLAAAKGATELTDVTRGHIDGCIYAHRANLIFAEKMAKMGAKVTIPTTINAISVDRERWQTQGVAPQFGGEASRLADAYTDMGARPSFTCAPYLLADPPKLGEHIGWSESNAVIFANSVLGARTEKHPDYLDLFIAMTGRAPKTGVYLTENRRPAVILEVLAPAKHDDTLWPLLGWVAGHAAPDRIPLLVGLEQLAPSQADLKALCASFGTTSAAPMLHIAGVTPESDSAPDESAARIKITRQDLAKAWAAFNTGGEKIDLVAIGSPHVSLEELRQFTDLLSETRVDSDTAVIVTLGRATRLQAAHEGITAQLEAAGVQLMSDLCWCSIIEPIFPSKARTVMTNSGKYAHYAPGLVGRNVRFGSLADCAIAAQTGFAPNRIPEWLRGP